MAGEEGRGGASRGLVGAEVVVVQLFGGERRSELGRAGDISFKWGPLKSVWVVCVQCTVPGHLYTVIWGFGPALKWSHTSPLAHNKQQEQVGGRRTHLHRYLAFRHQRAPLHAYLPVCLSSLVCVRRWTTSNRSKRKTKEND